MKDARKGDRSGTGNRASTKGTGRRGAWILAATILGSSMAYIDGTVVNVALPVLQKDFGARIDQVQWVVEAYTLLVASLVLVGGTLGDRYGRRRIYALGIAIYAIASLWCGLAPDIGQLVAARALQGIGGALLVPGSLAIITAFFPESERGRAIGTWSGLSAVSTAIGPLLGGWLVDNISWRGVFFINIPIAAVILLILFRHVPESSDDTAPRQLDWAGAVLVATGLGALVFGLIEANRLTFSHPLIPSALAAGALLLGAFIIVERRSPAPMLPLQLFTSRTFTGANLLTLFLYAALNGMFFFLGFNLIQVQGYSATATGAALLPFIVLLSTLSRWAGNLATVFGPRLLLAAGPTVCAAGYGLFLLSGAGHGGDGSYWTEFFPAIMVVGLGMALAVAPLTYTVMSSVSERHAGTASGINNSVSWLSGLLSIAVLGLVAVSSFSTGLERSLHTAGLPPDASRNIMEQRSKLAAVELPPELPEPGRTAARQVIQASFVESFHVMMLICAGLALVSGIAGFLMIEDPRNSKKAAGTGAG